MKKWITGLVFLLVLSSLFLACGKLSNKGTAPENVPPEVFLVNVPPEEYSTFSVLTKIYWYGFDQDGYISRYQYLVICDSLGIVPKVGGYIDSTFVKLIESVGPEDWNDDSLSLIFKDKGYYTIICDTSDTRIECDTTDKFPRTVLHAVDSVPTTVGTWDNVMLFASVDTSAIVPQYFFVRAVDNEGAVSKIWKPDSEKGSNFRLFKRTNRPPNTSVTYDTKLIEYCLPETTVDWKGIKITWSGTDPDYGPRSQPPLSYSWKLYGPLESKSSVVADSDIYYSSWDDSLKTPWVDSTSRLFVNLKNYKVGEKDYGYGWYQFRVQARDDAFVPDTSLATATFKIIKPPLLFSEDKKVLLVNSSVGIGVATPIRDSLESFYKGLLDSLVGSKKIDTFGFYRQTSSLRPPSEDMLSNYKLVIFVNEGAFSGLSLPTDDYDVTFIQIEKYLRVGGKVWMIGYNNFGLEEKRQFMPIDPGYRRTYQYSLTLVRVANYYFGVTGYYNPFLENDITLVGRNEEMIAAEPYGDFASVLPRLEVDPARLTKRYYDNIVQDPYPLEPPWDSLKGVPRAGYEAVWNANYNERLYTFISYKGGESILHGRACASRAYSPDPWTFYQEPGQPILQWRTAEFCFPCFAIKRDNMQTLMEVMVDWFLKEGVYP